MKKLFVQILFVLLISGNCISQEVDSSKGDCVVAATKMNFVYIGLDNPLSVCVPGYAVDQIKVETNYGTLTGENGSYNLVVPDSRGRFREVILSTYLRINDSFYLSGEKHFRIKKPPVPIAYFGSKNSGVVSYAELNLVQKIGIKSDYAYDGLFYEVDKYNFVFAPRYGQSTVFSVKGNQITESITTIFSTAITGDIIVIANIYAHLPDKQSRQLPGAIVLTVE